MLIYGQQTSGPGLMPHYRFHLVHGGPVILDTEGRDLPDLNAARDHAVRMTRSSLAEAVTIIDRTPGWQVEVLDRDSHLVLVVPFPFRPVGRAGCPTA